MKVMVRHTTWSSSSRLGKRWRLWWGTPLDLQAQDWGEDTLEKSYHKNGHI